MSFDSTGIPDERSTSAEAVEYSIRQQRTIQFLKFHDTKPLQDSQLSSKKDSLGKKLTNQFGTQRTIRDDSCRPGNSPFAELEPKVTITEQSSSNTTDTAKPGFGLASAGERPPADVPSGSILHGNKRYLGSDSIGQTQPMQHSRQDPKHQSQGLGAREIGIREVQTPRHNIGVSPASSKQIGSRPIGQYKTKSKPVLGIF